MMPQIGRSIIRESLAGAREVGLAKGYRRIK